MDPNDPKHGQAAALATNGGSVAEAGAPGGAGSMGLRARHEALRESVAVAIFEAGQDGVGFADLTNSEKEEWRLAADRALSVVGRRVIMPLLESALRSSNLDAALGAETLLLEIIGAPAAALH